MESFEIEWLSNTWDRMLRYLQSQGFDSIMSNGINTATEEIYSYLGFHVGELGHYYIPNRKLRTYSIAKFSKEKLDISYSKKTTRNLIFKQVKLQEVKRSFDFMKILNKIPRKDFEYFKSGSLNILSIIIRYMEFLKRLKYFHY